jgi:hypothetical protein
MYTLKIEHSIGDFATWKAAFDRDPAGRRQAGVLGFRIGRPPDDPRYVFIDLDFAEQDQAAAFLEVLRNTVWRRPDLSPALAREGGAVVAPPRTRIVEQVELQQG